MIQIPRCYDSHAHFLASSIFREAITLGLPPGNSLEAQLEGFNRMDLRTNSDLIFGFGWTTDWMKRVGLTRDFLDKVSGDKLIVLSRKDGHAIFVNSNVLDFLGLSVSKLYQLFPNFKSQIGLTPKQDLSGLFFDQVAFWLWSELLLQKPDFVKSKLLQSQQLWFDKGFTHVRDMSANWNQWSLLKQLDQELKLNIYLIQNFEHSHTQSLAVTIEQALKAKAQESHHLRVGGIKLFLDGTIGSQTAAISHAYLGCDHGGHLLFSDSELLEMTLQIWSAGLPACFHVIGDRGASQVLKTIKSLTQNGVTGQVHLEHLEICAPEVLDQLSDYNIVVHFQPCHYLEDHLLFEQSLPVPQKNWVFPWHQINLRGVPYFWGFDSPISQIGLERTYKGLALAEADGVLGPQDPWYQAHSHPDAKWGSECSTVVRFNDNGETDVKIMRQV